MKELLIDALFLKGNLKHIEKIRKFLVLLKVLNVQTETVALCSENKEFQVYFQFACLLRGTNYVIINSREIDSYMLSVLGVKLLLFDESSRLHKLPSLDYLFDITHVDILVNVCTLKIESINSNLENNGQIRIEYNLRLLSELAYKFIPNEVNLDLKELKKAFSNAYSILYRESTVYVIHPGNSSYGEKTSVYTSEILLKGVLKALNALQAEKYNLDNLNSFTYGNIALPYVFLLGVVIPFIHEREFYFKKPELDNFKTKSYVDTIDYVLISANNLTFLLLDIIDETDCFSFTKDKIFISLRNMLFSRFIFRRRFKFQNPMPIFVIYGNIDERLRKFLKILKIRVLYIYTMIEVASFISYKYYPKITSKALTVGKLPKKAVLNGKDLEGNAELLIDLEDQFITYTNTEFTQLCSMSEKYVGMHSTLDICSENKEGEVTVIGKAEELFRNQNGLLVQNSLIYSIVLNNRYVEDSLIVVLDNHVVVIVELRVSVLLLNKKTPIAVIRELNRTLLKEINKKVKPFSKVHRICLIPAGFATGNDSKIKLSNYLQHN